MRYVPWDELEGVPNIVVDGYGQADTVLALSHWPGAGTPEELRDDLSTQVAFHYLDRPDLHVDVEAVSNNHFDEDGLTAMYTVLEPEGALRRRPMVIDVAAAGDFSTYRFRDAARVAFGLWAYQDPDRSPLRSTDADLYPELLPVLPEMIDHVDRYRELWAPEDAALTASEAAVRDGAVRVEDVPDLDLTVVTVPEAVDAAVWEDDPVHPMAVHNVTRCFRTLVMQGRRYVLRYRYESWVDYRSAELTRVDLGPLADRLNEEENHGVWGFDGVQDITPRLRLRGAEESAIPPERFRRLVETFLRAAVSAPSASR